MLIASVIFLVTDKGNVTVLVHFGCKDYDIARLLIVVGCNDGAFSFKVPFKVVLFMLTIPVQFLNEFLLLTTFHLLYAVIDPRIKAMYARGRRRSR